MTEKHTHLSACSLALAMGLTFGLGVFLLGIVAWLSEYGDEIVDLFATVYCGYDATLLGSVYGFAWGFAEGIILGFAIGFFYNLVQKCKCCYHCK